MNFIKKIVSRLSILLMTILFIATSTSSVNATRIKDIVDVEGVRDNMLVGYGLVVGLNGTGDSLGNSPFTRQSLIAMLERMGVNIRDQNINTQNIAAVIVTATLPPFTNQGTKIDITISTLGDSDSLQGGTLLVTPLLGADAKVYAVAQGPLVISGFTADGDGASVTQGTPTTARIASGAIVEREIKFDLNELETVRLGLRNPDFTTARRIAKAINRFTGTGIANAENPASVKVRLPKNRKTNFVELITDIEQLRIEPDQIAKVIIDEKSGTIVMGRDVRISTVAIAQGSLTIRISENPEASQPAPFSTQGETVILPRTDIFISNDEDAKLAVLNDGVSLQDLVTSLNSLGIGPRDIITILQSIKAAGALQAEIEVI